MAAFRNNTGRGGGQPLPCIVTLMILVLLSGAISACRPAQEVTDPAAPALTQTAIPPTATVTPTALPTSTPSATSTPSPTQLPAGMNPLTGLLVDDPAVLARRPLLIKVSNFPPVVRPQNGLQSADHVWEHVVEGMKHVRLTAVFYGQTPESVGSVRSGRLPDLELVPMYGGLYFASGFSSNRSTGGPPRMRELMEQADWFERNFSGDFGVGAPYAIRVDIPGVAFEHTLFVIPEKLWELADDREVNQPPELKPGWAYTDDPPEGGLPTAALSVDYPQDGALVEWRYDPEVRRWLRWTDGAAHGDYLTGEQLAFDNVVLFYAEHYEADFVEYESPTARILSVGVLLQGEGDAVLLRDGLRYPVTWRRNGLGDMIRFYGAGSDLIAFKPGRTWFQVVSTTISVPEVAFE